MTHECSYSESNLVKTNQAFSCHKTFQGRHYTSIFMVTKPLGAQFKPLLSPYITFLFLREDRRHIILLWKGVRIQAHQQSCVKILSKSIPCPFCILYAGEGLQPCSPMNILQHGLIPLQKVVSVDSVI